MIRIPDLLVAIADRKFWNWSNLAQIAWHDKGGGGGPAIRNGSYQMLIRRWRPLNRGTGSAAVRVLAAVLA